jgi:hypothetical protein
MRAWPPALPAPRRPRLSGRGPRAHAPCGGAAAASAARRGRQGPAPKERFAGNAYTHPSAPWPGCVPPQPEAAQLAAPHCCSHTTLSTHKNCQEHAARRSPQAADGQAGRLCPAAAQWPSPVQCSAALAAQNTFPICQRSPGLAPAPAPAAPERSGSQPAPPGAAAEGRASLAAAPRAAALEAPLRRLARRLGLALGAQLREVRGGCVCQQARRAARTRRRQPGQPSCRRKRARRRRPPSAAPAPPPLLQPASLPPLPAPRRAHLHRQLGGLVRGRQRPLLVRVRLVVADHVAHQVVQLLAVGDAVGAAGRVGRVVGWLVGWLGWVGEVTAWCGGWCERRACVAGAGRPAGRPRAAPRAAPHLHRMKQALLGWRCPMVWYSSHSPVISWSKGRWSSQ